MIRKTGLAVATAALVLGGCSNPPSYNYLERTLIQRQGRVMPRVHGTQYDCKIATEALGPDNIWQANVGGRILSAYRPYNISTEACFPTQAECEAFLYLMNGYLEEVITSRCELGRHKGIFDWSS